MFIVYVGTKNESATSFIGCCALSLFEMGSGRNTSEGGTIKMG